MEIKGTQILPEKEGSRVLVYPCYGIDFSWIHFAKSDTFIGVDLEQPQKHVTGGWSKMTQLILEKRDASTPPEIPVSDEIVLLLKGSIEIGFCEKVKDSPENWANYQKIQANFLRNYLTACEKSSERKVYVVDFHGYGDVITPLGYRILLPNLRSNICKKLYVYCDDENRLCDKAHPLLSWENVTDKEKMNRHHCPSGGTRIVHDDGLTYLYTKNLVTYVKEKQ